MRSIFLLIIVLAHTWLFAKTNRFYITKRHKFNSLPFNIFKFRLIQKYEKNGALLDINPNAPIFNPQITAYSFERQNSKAKEILTPKSVLDAAKMFCNDILNKSNFKFSTDIAIFSDFLHKKTINFKEKL